MPFDGCEAEWRRPGEPEGEGPGHGLPPGAALLVSGLALGLLASLPWLHAAAAAGAYASAYAAAWAGPP